MGQIFRADLLDFEKTVFPFVRIVYIDVDGNERDGLLLIDSASNKNMLSAGILKYLSANDIIEGESHMFVGIQNQGKEGKAHNIVFSINGASFREIFWEHSINFDEMLWDGNGLILGCVGNEFLINYGLILDYKEQCLRQSDGSSINPNDCSFYFPLAFGMKRYQNPVVVAAKDNQKFILFADSGCDCGWISKKDMKAMGKEYHSLNSEDTFLSISYNEVTSLFNISFDLYTMLADNSLRTIAVDNNFRVSENKNQLFDMKGQEYEGKPLLPVTGLIGSSFMLKNKWILDFNMGVIYSLYR